MKILPHKVEITDDKITPRAGLVPVLEEMDRLGLAERIDQVFPKPGSNRAYPHSTHAQTLMLMFHEGAFHLEGVDRLREDAGSTELLDSKLPCPQVLGEWLRRMGALPNVTGMMEQVNQLVLLASLGKCEKVTMDIDASEVMAGKRYVKFTYNKNPGYMPIVGHIAETGQVVALDFRDGNMSLVKDNLAFIRQCEGALPAGAAGLGVAGCTHG